MSLIEGHGPGLATIFKNCGRPDRTGIEAAAGRVVRTPALVERAKNAPEIVLGRESILVNGVAEPPRELRTHTAASRLGQALNLLLQF